MRIKQRFVRIFVCSLFGHKPCLVLERRPRRDQRGKPSWKNRRTRMVAGTYEECARCGEKLSEYKRCSNHVF